MVSLLRRGEPGGSSAGPLSTNHLFCEHLRRYRGAFEISDLRSHGSGGFCEQGFRAALSVEHGDLPSGAASVHHAWDVRQGVWEGSQGESRVGQRPLPHLQSSVRVQRRYGLPVTSEGIE